jgi:hypothetical protein
MARCHWPRFRRSWSWRKTLPDLESDVGLSELPLIMLSWWTCRCVHLTIALLPSADIVIITYSTRPSKATLMRIKSTHSTLFISFTESFHIWLFWSMIFWDVSYLTRGSKASRCCRRVKRSIKARKRAKHRIFGKIWDNANIPSHFGKRAQFRQTRWILQHSLNFWMFASPLNDHDSPIHLMPCGCFLSVLKPFAWSQVFASYAAEREI